MQRLPPFSPRLPGSNRCVGDVSLFDSLRWLWNRRVFERMRPLAPEVETARRELYKGAVGEGFPVLI
jgi:hypothetical protein